MLQRFLLALDGKLAGRFSDFSGGSFEADIQELRGSTRKVASPKFKDMVVVCGPGMSRAFYEWVAATFNGSAIRKDGAVIILDDHSKPVYRMDFRGGLVKSISLPELDASQNGDATLTVTISPESVAYSKPGVDESLGVYTSAVANSWHVNDFHISIAGLESDCKYVTRIRSVSMEETIVGDEKSHARFPGAIRNSRLSIDVPRAHAGWIL